MLNVEDHKAEAAEFANLFHQLNGLVPVIVSEPILAANCEDNIGDHDDGYENQVKRIKPLLQMRLRPSTETMLSHRISLYIFVLFRKHFFKFHHMGVVSLIFTHHSTVDKADIQRSGS